MKDKFNKSENRKDGFYIIIGPSKVRGGITTVINSHLEIFKKSNIPFKTINTTAYYSGRNGKNLFIFLGAVFEILSLSKPLNGVHLHLSAGRDFYRNFFLFNLLKLKFGKTPVVLHIHYGDFPSWGAKFYHKLWVYIILKLSNGVIVNIPFFKTELEKMFPFIKGKIYVLPNMIPFSPPEKIPPRKFIEPYHIFYLGYIKFIKSSQFLLQAIEKACVNNLPFKFTLVGPGGDVRLVTKAKQLSRKYPQKVNYKPWISDEEKKELFSQVDFFIQPSSTESFSIVTYEAMAWGLPVIAVKKGGPAYLLNDRGAFWVKPDSQESIYNLFLKIINSKVQFNSMSQANRERAFELYNYPVSKKLLEIYKLVFHQ